MQQYLLPLTKFSIMYQTAALLEVLSFLVSITNACSLLPIFNCLDPIFTFVLTPCKFIGICEVWECLHQHLSLAQECAFEVNLLFMLYISCFGAVLYTRHFLYKTELKDALQECTSSTLDFGSSAPTASPYTLTAIGLHYLLIPTAVCKQQQAKSISCLLT